MIKSNMKKTGRNDTCPCGSGKKYKKCCMNKSNIEISKHEPIFPNYKPLPKKTPHTCDKCGASTIHIGMCDGTKFISYSPNVTKEQIINANKWLENVKKYGKK